ncbi:MAG: YdcF family protein [Bacillota bacterium]
MKTGKYSWKWTRLIIIFLVACLATGLISGLVLFHEITKYGEIESLTQADVIIVLGSAVWPTGLSPSAQARVYKGVQVYSEGWAARILFTGGLGKYPPAEALAMKAAALDMGVADMDIYLEIEAKNTRENMRFSKKVMDDHGWQTAILVSDPFHMKRAVLLAQKAGIKAFPAPAKNSVLYLNRDLRLSYTVRETVAIVKDYLGLTFLGLR